MRLGAANPRLIATVESTVRNSPYIELFSSSVSFVFQRCRLRVVMCLISPFKSY